MTDYICVLDFEATCWYENSNHEIIEFPSVLLKWDNDQLQDNSNQYDSNQDNSNQYDSNQDNSNKDTHGLKEIARFQQFVKPLNNPCVSDFCTELTGITQKQVNNGIDLKSAIEAHLKWITDITKSKNVTIVTCGDWDLNKMLPLDLKNISYEPNELYARYANIKDLFKIATGIKGTGMKKMLDKLNLNIEGRHHSGIDDCHNIARIFIELVKKGLSKQNLLDNIKFVEYCTIRRNPGGKNRQKYKKYEGMRRLNKIIN